MQHNKQGYFPRLLLVRMGEQEVCFFGRVELMYWITNGQGNFQRMMLAWTPYFGIMQSIMRISSYGVSFNPLPHYEQRGI